MDKDYYKKYFRLERNHWWFRARMEILESLVEKQIQGKDKLEFNILNTGVATGATTTMLSKFGAVKSLEYDEDCCRFLRETLNMEVIQGSLTELPFEDGSFDMVCAFDVIEHIENDSLAIQEINRVLKPEGRIFLTVPAFDFLWSEHDVINHHFRRYTLKSLCKILKQENFRISFKSYFNFFLFFPIASFRVLSNLFTSTKEDFNVKQLKSDFEKFQGNSLSSKIFYRIFRSENWFLNKRLKFPFGVSILFIGVKL